MKPAGLTGGNLDETIKSSDRKPETPMTNLTTYHCEEMPDGTILCTPAKETPSSGSERQPCSPSLTPETDAVNGQGVGYAQRFYAMKGHARKLERERNRLKDAIRWALGEGEEGFREQCCNEGKYWWRKELRQRASSSPENVSGHPAALSDSD